MSQIFTLVIMVLIAAFSRLIPHPWNFTAVGAMALFGGAYFQSKKQSFLIPVVALFLSDLVLGFHSTMVFVYGAFLLAVAVGWTLREKRSVTKVGALALVTSTIFFGVSNFGVWMTQGMYPMTPGGLLACYVAAIPFFENQVLGDLFFTAILFGGFEAVKMWAPQFVMPATEKNNF